jgi:hypothetical protein
VKTITFEIFEKTYKPIKNPFVQNSSYDGCMFETYGVELAHVREQDVKKIWTIVDCNNEEIWIVPGYSIVDRIGYLICDTPWESEDIQVNDNEMVSDLDATKHCYDFAKSIDIQLSINDLSDFFNLNKDENEMTTGRAKYLAIEFIEKTIDNDLSDEHQDLIHNYYSQL